MHPSGLVHILCYMITTTSFRCAAAALRLFLGGWSPHADSFDQRLTGICLSAYSAYSSRRYLVDRIHRLRNTGVASIVTLIATATNTTFCSEVRCQKRTFNRILIAIRDHPVFNCTPQNPQHPLEVQLLIFLYRAGRVALSLASVSVHYGISIGSVLNCSTRVIVALNAAAPTFISWPTPAERIVIKQEFVHGTETRPPHPGFDECIGTLDCTQVFLTTRPEGIVHPDGTRNSAFPLPYMSARFKRYSIVTLAVVDSNGYFRFVDCGWPGSVHDSRVFRAGPFAQPMPGTFAPGEYLLADKGFVSTPNVVACYKKPRNAEESPENMRFNHFVAAGRVIIEHNFGVLKGRWRSLQSLALRIRESHGAQDQQAVVNWIMATIVLHNMCLVFQDTTPIEKWRSKDEVEIEEYAYEPLGGGMPGPDFREALKLRVLAANVGL